MVSFGKVLHHLQLSLVKSFAGTNDDDNVTDTAKSLTSLGILEIVFAAIRSECVVEGFRE